MADGTCEVNAITGPTALFTSLEADDLDVNGLSDLKGGVKVDQVFSSENGINNAMISIVKEGSGNSWIPGYPNWIGDMKPGQGYEVWINPEFTNDQDIDFTFPQ